MRGKIRLALLAFLLMSCSKESMVPESRLDFEYGRDITHGKIVLGNRLENPYKTENIAKALDIDLDCVNVKATTTEKLGFEGEGLGISSQAVCIVYK